MTDPEDDLTTGSGDGPAGRWRTVLVPDLVDELTETLRQGEEVLLTLAAWEADPDDGAEPFVLPAPLSNGTALAAVQRLITIFSGTQTPPDLFDQGHQSGPRMIGPDGRHEHMPLRAVALLTRDLECLTATAAELGRVVTLDPGGELAEAVDAGADAAAPTYGPAPTARDIVERLARLYTAGGADLVLDTAAEAAYQRLADRMNAMWTSSNPIDRFLY
jgi:hypothetical protein